MRIAVCLKQAPDCSSVYVDPVSGEVDRERFVQTLNAADACALEAALRLKEQRAARFSRSRWDQTRAMRCCASL